MRYPLPQDTAKVLEDHAKKGRNLGLVLDRLQPINPQTHEDPWNLTDEAKRRQGAGQALGDPVPRLLSAVNQRRQEMWNGLERRGYMIRKLTAAPDYRLVIGFGAEHVLETNLALHRIYGFPVIPGSAVKGVARAMAFWQTAVAVAVPTAPLEEREKRREQEKRTKVNCPTPLQLFDQLLSASDEKEQRDLLQRLQQDVLCRPVAFLQSLTLSAFREVAEDFWSVFGTTSRRGRVVFYDAFPTTTPKLEVDVLNPHYGPYYRGTSPPGNYLDPVPTYFLTVAPGCPFVFVAASKEPALADKAQRWLKGAIEELGIGGKTSAGYGFMKEMP